MGVRRDSDQPPRGSRRLPPDYSQRATKLKLFGYVAAVMVVLAIAERARDPEFVDVAMAIRPRGGAD